MTDTHARWRELAAAEMARRGRRGRDPCEEILARLDEMAANLGANELEPDPAAAAEIEAWLGDWVRRSSRE